MKFPFITLIITTVALVGATVVEKICGTQAAMTYVYHSPLTIAMWCVTAVAAMWVVVRKRKAMSAATFAIHTSLALILTGAAVTFLTATEGTLHLDENTPQTNTFTTTGGRKAVMPFSISLEKSSTHYYPGTSSAMDYASDVRIEADGTTETRRVAMNRVLTVKGYRLYQTGIGSNSSTLTVSHDPWGTGITYTGYAMLFASMILFFFSKKSRFRHLLKAVAVSLALIAPAAAHAHEATPLPETLQRPLARNFGKLYVMWNGRVAPLNTLAREFCLKVYGKESYRGLTADQVLTGWLFYYDDWKREPFIKIKDGNVRQLLGIKGRYATLTDFYRNGQYMLDNASENERTSRGLMEADEKVALISQVCTGSAFKIFPYNEPDGSTTWFSWADKLPAEMDASQWGFITSVMEQVARNIAHGKFRDTNTLLTQINGRQKEWAGIGNLPGSTRFKAELLYNRISATFAASMFALACGLIAFALFCFSVAGGRCKKTATISRRLILAAAWGLTAYVAIVMTLRGIAAAHLPLANGHETMLAMALAALLLTIGLCHRIKVLLPAGLTVAGLALMVASMGESNPAVTPLMPVLASPLLSIHVMFVMAGYALFAIIAINSIASFCLFRYSDAVKRLANVSQLLLYPALFLLGAGIFTGAIWANQSWGRYWGWDPKETWALITFFVYAIPVHASSFPAFRRPGTVHIYLFAAFITVLITYFGVNYFLTGLHSYATS